MPHAAPAPAFQSPASTKGFWSLFVVQFQGAFSDNVYRTLAMFLVVNMTLPYYNDASRPLRMAIVGAFVCAAVHSLLDGGWLSRRPL
jgi:hypothetical protein